jgi:hypothetical protein
MRHPIRAAALALLIFATESYGAAALKKPIERSVNAEGVRGKITIRQISSEQLSITVKAQRGTLTDTVRGSSIIPLMVYGRRQQFFFGKFGTSLMPMLILSVEDPDRIGDSHVLAYEVSSSGVMIGQQVLTDEAIKHKHADEVSGGRYELAAVDPKLGAIYSVAYQEAKFEGFYLAYEKLRVRQWEAALGAFIETDQGFLRDQFGRIVESSRFHLLTDPARERMFAQNVAPHLSIDERYKPKAKIVTASSKTASQ